MTYVEDTALIEEICRVLCEDRGLDPDREVITLGTAKPMIIADEETYNPANIYKRPCWKLFEHNVGVVLSLAAELGARRK